MKADDFLKECDINEFVDWLKDVCIEDSFRNIKPDKEFKCIIINDMDFEGEVSYHLLRGMTNVAQLYFHIRRHITFLPKEKREFSITDNTRLFTYSNTYELLQSNSKDLESMRILLNDTIDNFITDNKTRGIF